MFSVKFDVREACICFYHGRTLPASERYQFIINSLSTVDNCMKHDFDYFHERYVHL